MITDEQKYRAYTFNFAGFALMTPFAKIIMDPLQISKEHGLLALIIYILIGFTLFVLGGSFIDTGRNILTDKRRI